MVFWRWFSFLLLTVGLSSTALADDSRRAFNSSAPKAGRQWITFGFVLSPGFTHDTRGPNRGVAEYAPHFGAGYQLGLVHALSERFYMAVEGEIGGTYVRPHTMSPTGVADAERSFSWKVGLYGRYNLAGQTDGATLGLGLSTFLLSLDDASLQTLNVDLRAGWRFWYGYDFAMIELGYAWSALEGLNVSSFGNSQPVDENWVFHRFSLSFIFGF